jgi:hypothetical protein
MALAFFVEQKGIWVKDMKIFFAGTNFRNSIGLNKQLPVRNHLESYLSLKGIEEKFFRELYGNGEEEDSENRSQLSKRRT